MSRTYSSVVLLFIIFSLSIGTNALNGLDAEDCLNQYCYVPRNLTIVPDVEYGTYEYRFYEEYINCLKTDDSGDCSACTLYWKGDKTKELPSTCTECAKTCQTKIKTDHESKLTETGAIKFVKYTSQCRIDCYSSGTFPQTDEYRKEVNGTVQGYINCESELISSGKYNLSTIFYQDYKICKQYTKQCQEANRIFAAAKPNDRFPFESFICYDSCNPPAWDQDLKNFYKDQLDCLKRNFSQTPPEIIDPIQTQTFTQQQFDSCLKTNQISCPLENNVNYNSTCKIFIDKMNTEIKNKLETSQCKKDLEVLISCLEDKTDKSYRFPKSCTEFYENVFNTNFTYPPEDQYSMVFKTFFQDTLKSCAKTAKPPALPSIFPPTYQNCLNACNQCTDYVCYNLILKQEQCMKENQTEQCKTAFSTYSSDLPVTYAQVACRQSCMNSKTPDMDYLDTFIGTTICQPQCFGAANKKYFHYKNLSDCITNNIPSEFKNNPESQAYQKLWKCYQETKVNNSACKGKSENEFVDIDCSLALQKCHIDLEYPDDFARFDDYVASTYLSCVTNGDILGSSLVVAGLSQQVEACANAAKAKVPASSQTKIAEYEDCLANSTQQVCNSSIIIFNEQIAKGSLAVVPFTKAACAYSCRKDSSDITNYLNEYENCLIKEENSTVFQNFNETKAKSCVQRQVPYNKNSNQDILQEWYKQFDKNEFCQPNCTFGGDSSVRVKKECYQCLYSTTYGNQKYRSEHNDSIFLEYMVKPHINCYEVNNYPLPETNSQTIRNVDHCLQISCLNKRTACQSDTDCNQNYSQFDQCVNSQSNQDKTNQFFLSAVEYQLRKLKSTDSKYPTERLNTRMVCARISNITNKNAQELMTCENECAMKGKMHETELLDITFKQIGDCQAFQVPKQEVDKTAWEKYGKCLASETIPSCKICEDIYPENETLVDDKPYYEVCQKCRKFCTNQITFTSAISPILNLECLNRGRISDDLKEKLIPSSATVEQANACLNSDAYKTLNDTCSADQDTKCSDKRNEYLKNHIDICENAHNITKELLADTPEKRVPFEMHACIYAQQPLVSEVNTTWGKLWAAQQSCYISGNTNTSLQPARLNHFYSTSQQNIQQYCYVPSVDNLYLTSVFESYFSCMFEDSFYEECRLCQEDFRKGFQQFVLATCVQCQQLCKQRTIRQNFIEDKKFEEYTFQCHYHAIAERQYQLSTELKKKLSGTKFGFQSYYDNARLKGFINTTSTEYQTFKNCTETLIQCLNAYTNFAALKDTDGVPLDLYLCHQTCYPDVLTPPFDKIRLHLNQAYSNTHDVLQGQIYRDVQTMPFTEKDFQTCQSNANYQCAKQSDSTSKCNEALKYYDDKKKESKLLKTCQEDRTILKAVLKGVTDLPFPVSCAEYHQEAILVNVSVERFDIIQLYVQPAAVGCAANALNPTFDSHLVASNSEFAECVSKSCPVCTNEACLQAQRDYTDCQLKNTSQTKQCESSMNYVYDQLESNLTFGSKRLSFQRVICKEACLETVSNDLFGEILACQQKCYLAGKSATFTYSELNICLNLHTPRSFHPQRIEAEKYLARFEQDIHMTCSSTCGKFRLTESKKELKTQVTYACQSCLNTVLAIHLKEFSGKNLTLNSLAETFVRYIHPAFDSCINLGHFKNSQVSLKKTIDQVQQCVTAAEVKCDNNTPCNVWRTKDNDQKKCKENAAICLVSKRKETESAGFTNILTANFETHICNKFCQPIIFNTTNSSDKEIGEKYLQDVDDCYLQAPPSDFEDSGLIVENCIKLTVAEPSNVTQPEQNRYFQELKTCRSNCYANKSGSETAYDCSLKCAAEKYAGWTKFREEFVQNVFEGINRCMRVGILPVYQLDSIKIAQEGDCEAYECSTCEGDEGCENYRKKFEECLAPANQSTYCKSAFQRYRTLKESGPDALYPHEMNTCKDSCLPEGSLEANAKFKQFWSCRRSCSLRAYQAPLTSYASVKTCLGNLRETITKDPEGNNDYVQYESCFKGTESPECAKCNKKTPSNDSDAVYEHCARCHYQCVNKQQFKKFEDARTRITRCWTKGSLSKSLEEHLVMGHTDFSYKQLNTCNNTNCMTPFSNALDSNLHDIYKIYLNCQQSNEYCKKCFADANANRSSHMMLSCQQCVIECRDFVKQEVKNPSLSSSLELYLSHFQRYVTDCQLQCTHFGSLNFLEEIKSTTDSVYHCRNQLIQNKKIIISETKSNFSYFQNCTRSSQQCRISLELAKSSSGEEVYPYGLYQCYQSCRPPLNMTEEFRSSWEWEQYCFNKPQAQIAQNQFNRDQNVYCEKSNLPKCPGASSCEIRSNLYNSYQLSIPECEKCNQYIKLYPNNKRYPFTSDCKSCKLASLEKVRATQGLDQNSIFTEISEQVIQQCAVQGYVREIIYTKSLATLESYSHCYSDLCTKYECNRSPQQELCETNDLSKQRNINNSPQCTMADEEMSYYAIYGSPNDPIPFGKSICHESTAITSPSIDFTYLQKQNCISFCLSNFYVRAVAAPTPKPVDPVIPVDPSSFSRLNQFFTIITILIISLLF